MPALVFIAGPNAGRRYKLADGEYIIGRRSDCQIFVPDMRVSRQHARIRPDGVRWALEDLGSNNGTYVNGQRLSGPLPLAHGDEIMIASNRIRVDSPDTDGHPLVMRGGAIRYLLELSPPTAHHPSPSVFNRWICG